jgi:DNA-binding transcriptional LysR family regulator
MPRPVTLSLDLLHTFVRLVENEGDASATAQQLGINQPSMSKRLSFLQHSGRVLVKPWLVREGKTWKLTEVGKEVLPAVKEIIQRFEQLTAFVPRRAGPWVRFACGQEAVVGFVKTALRAFQQRHPESRVRVSTPRGKERIVGVANGSLDLATVTHSEAAIRRLARRRLHVEPLLEARLALVCAPDAEWAASFGKALKTRAPAEALLGYPLILPEPNAGIRKAVDRVLEHKGLLGQLDIMLEVGGWAAILAYVREKFGVGLVASSALEKADDLVVRYLDPEVFPPVVTRLICRRLSGTGELHLTPAARDFYDTLRRAVKP